MLPFSTASPWAFTRNTLCVQAAIEVTILPLHINVSGGFTADENSIRIGLEASFLGPLWKRESGIEFRSVQDFVYRPL